MNKYEERIPGWIAENDLARSMGFTCVKDEHRGGPHMEWSSFVMGQWHVWEIISWNGSNRGIAWQVARLDADGYYREHYTRRHLKPGEYGVDGPGFLELKDALIYAKEKAS